MSMAKRAKAGPKSGRPPKAAADRRDVLVKVLTTAEEYKVLQAAAEQASMSLSTWMRAAALAMARQQPV
jgi:uncharacterized protein (DUF1778 family)